MNKNYLQQFLAVVLLSMGVAVIQIHGQVVISEFMAANNRTLADEDGDYPDWIELYNSSTNAVNLDHWYLTDSSKNLMKWRFPATNIGPNSFMVVFASGKDRTVPGQWLHTSFQIKASGGFLALVKPDGVTVASAFNSYPPQISDISYGLPGSVVESNLVAAGSVGKIMVPQDGSQGLLWTGANEPYNDAGWVTVTNGIGYYQATNGPGTNLSIIYVGVQSAQGWRTTSAPKYYDLDGDGVYGTAGYIMYATDDAANANAGKCSGVNPLTYVEAPPGTMRTRKSIPAFLTVTNNGQNGVCASYGYPTVDDPEVPPAPANMAAVELGLATRSNVTFGTEVAMVNLVVGTNFPVSGLRIGVMALSSGSDSVDIIRLGGTGSANSSAATLRSYAAPVSIYFFDVKGAKAGDILTLYLTKNSSTGGNANAAYVGLLFDVAPNDFADSIATSIQSRLKGVNASVYTRFQFTVADPAVFNSLTLRMKYDDGFVAYLNGTEIARRNAPEYTAGGRIANSVLEFSGTQGAGNWYYGYYDRSADPDGVYQTGDFTPFPQNFWTGSLWDWPAGNPPWTAIGPDTQHPNGINSGPEQWVIRRWQSPVRGTLNITVNYAKQNTSCGDGVTVRVLRNGMPIFQRVLAYNEGTWASTNLVVPEVEVGDLFDFAVDANGSTGSSDSCDNTYLTVTIDQQSSPPLTWYSTALSARQNQYSVPFVDFDLGRPDRWLVPGTNVLAIQGLNASVADADFLLMPVLTARLAQPGSVVEGRYFPRATPGAANNAGATVIGPVVDLESYSPTPPQDGDNLIVTARVTPTFAPVGSVVLKYRVMFGTEVSLTMFDDGQHGDGLAADGVYGAIIPASASTPGQMVRWYFIATDVNGVSMRWPLYDNPSDSPQYFGTVISDPNVSSALPVLHWFIENPSGADTDAGARCSVYFNGEFYDNVWINIHGQSSRGFPKKSYDISFNSGYDFRYDTNQSRVGGVNMMTTYPDKAHMRNMLGYETYRDAGCPYHWVFPIRVQRNGAFWGDAHLMENGNGTYLKRNGRDPDGALYKMYNAFNSSSHTTIGQGGTYAEKKTRTYEGNADLVALYNGVVAQSGTARTQFIYDYINIPQMVNFLAARAITADRDCCHKNYYLYRDSNNTGQWEAFPWDVDLSFGRSWTNTLTYWDDTMTWWNELLNGSNNGIFGALYGIPEIRQMYLRRVITLRDKLFQTPDTPPNLLRYEKRMDEWLALIAPDAALDLAKWGTWGNGVAITNCCVQTMAQAVDLMKNGFMVPRRYFLMTNQYLVGLSSQPTNVFIAIAEFDFNPASRNQDHEYICLTNPNPYAVDISGWQLSGGIRFTFEPGTVIPSNSLLYVSPNIAAFRQRPSGPRGGQGLFVRGNYSGRLSAWGETVTLTDDTGRLVHTNGYAPAPSLAQRYLRITEIMYHPVAGAYAPESLEFVELKNISTNETLDLNGVRFTEGIYFDFTGSAVTNLGPGQKVLVVKNIDAFRSFYGNLTNIAGVYTGSLDNGGETIRLDDAAGEKILEFAYDNKWYLLTDGLGFSLEVVDESTPWYDWGKQQNWRPSTETYGTPGRESLAPPVIPPIKINELLSASPTGALDAVELFNPTDASVDIGGWWLTDDFYTPRKYFFLPGTVIPAHGFLVVTEADFNANPGMPNNFAFSSLGDEVYLFSGTPDGQLTGYYHGFNFGAAAQGITFGRYLNSQGREFFVAQITNTLGTTNAGPLVGPVVITEIHYHPADIWSGSAWLDGSSDEFVELQNITATNVPLYDTEYPTNRWRLKGGVSFTFPTGIVLPPAGYLLVVNFNPQTDAAALESFRNRYAVAPEIPILGPLGGQLNNAGDTVELARPNPPVAPPASNAGQVGYVTVDRVEFGNVAPWPCGADGGGNSLQRRQPEGFGNDPINWQSDWPTPGSAATVRNAALPMILAHPATQAVPVGGSAAFNVTLCEVPADSYQWLRDGVAIEGANQPTLGLTNVQTTDSGLYSVVLSNAAGVLTSRVAALIVQTPPIIVTQPQSQTAVAFTTVAFGVDVSGVPPYHYQWRFNGVGLPGATNATLVLSNVQSAQAGNYQVEVSNTAGAATSAVATLVVRTPPVIIQQPRDTLVTNGYSTSLSVSVIGDGPLTYTWVKNATNVIAVNSPVLNFTSATTNDAGAYYVIVSNTVGVVTSATANLTVMGLAILRHPQSQIVAVGTPVELAVEAGGSQPIGYRWIKGGTTIVPAPGTNRLVFINPQIGTSGVYSVRVTNSVSYSGIPSSNAHLVVVAPPTNQAVTANSDVTFRVVTNVVAQSTNRFQWQFNGADLPGETNSVLLITNVQTYQSGDYAVFVTNISGRVAATFHAQLLVRPQGAPVLTIQPTNQEVLLGSNAVLAAWATGTEPLRYQWTFNGMPLPDATNATLVLSNVQPEHGGPYQVIAANDFGADTSQVAILVVLSPPSIVEQPEDAVAPLGGDAIFAVVASGTSPFYYQWWFNGTNQIAGATNATLILTNIGAGQWGEYHVVVSNRAGTVASTVATLSLPAPPSWTVQPQDVAVAVGYNATFTAQADGYGPIAYQWYFQGQAIDMATQPTLLVPNTRFMDSGPYYVVASNAGGMVTSVVVQLYVQEPPAIATQPENLTIAAGAEAVFIVAATGSQPLSYQWWFNGTNLVAGATNATLVLTNVQLSQSGSYHVRVANLVGEVFSQPAILTVVNPDSDGDGIPDEWEIAHGLNPQDGADRNQDADGDGLSNWQEYIAGTDPQNPQSVLKARWAPGDGGIVLLQFDAISNRNYTVEYLDSMPASNWISLTNFVPAPSNRIIGLPFTVQTNHTRYFRIKLSGNP